MYYKKKTLCVSMRSFLLHKKDFVVLTCESDWLSSEIKKHSGQNAPFAEMLL